MYPISNFSSVRRSSTVRPQHDFSRSFCSCCCPPLLPCSFIECAVRSSFTLSSHFIGCLPLPLVPSTCPYSATAGSRLPSIRLSDKPQTIYHQDLGNLRNYWMFSNNLLCLRSLLCRPKA